MTVSAQGPGVPGASRPGPWPLRDATARDAASRRPGTRRPWLRLLLAVAIFLIGLLCGALSAATGGPATPTQAQQPPIGLSLPTVA